MFQFLKNYCLTVNFFTALVWLLLLGSSQAEAKIKFNVVLKSERAVDICGDTNSKEILISINLGKIYYSDSLYGCNFELNYNPKNIILHSALSVNTLSEFFEWNQVGFFKEGRVNGSLLTGIYDQQVVGDKPLIVLDGVYTGNCPDTASVNLSFIEFTDEFRKEPDTLFGAIIKGQILDLRDRYFDAGFTKDTVIFGTDSTVELIVSADAGNMKNLKNADFEIKLADTQNVYITEIKPMNNRLIIDSLVKTSDGFIVKTKIIDSLNKKEIFRVRLKEKVLKKSEVQIDVLPLKLNDCACVTRLFSGKSVILDTTEEEPKSVLIEKEKENEKISSYYDYYKDEFVLKSEDNFKEIELFDINLNCILKNKEEINVLKIDAKDISKGIYFAIINKKKIMILIKN